MTMTEYEKSVWDVDKAFGYVDSRHSEVYHDETCLRNIDVSLRRIADALYRLTHTYVHNVRR